ncbi:hypothetical protein [Streptomyces abikoensis]
MSLNREHVYWQSENGTWSMGFWAYDYTKDASDEDFDHEWDVEYFDFFGWVSTGHSSVDAADEAYMKQGPNHGGGEIVAWTPDSAEEIRGYEKLAADCAAGNPGHVG